MTDFRFHLIVGSEAIVTRLLEAIRSAKTVIRIQFFTFEGDRVGKIIADALIEKAHQGVAVQFLCDDFSNWKINDRWLFTLHSPRLYLSLLHEWYQTQKMRLEMQLSGISLKLTDPLNFFKFRASLTSRDHRKLVIVDDNIAFTGGFNLSEHNYSWHDTFTEIHDSTLIESLVKLYLDTFSRKVHTTEPEIIGDTMLFHDTQTLMRYLRGITERANEHVYFESTYFTDSKIIRTLLNKVKSRAFTAAIIIPPLNNTRHIGRIHKRYRKLYPWLFKLRVTPPVMTHAKHALIDQCAVFGSSNFLSSKIIDNHKELTLVTTDHNYVKELESYFTSSLKTQCI